MAGPNRKTFKYRLRRGAQNQSDPARQSELKALENCSRYGSSQLKRIDESLCASAEDIATYRQHMGR